MRRKGEGYSPIHKIIIDSDSAMVISRICKSLIAADTFFVRGPSIARS